jgi:hypothetical protein
LALRRVVIIAVVGCIETSDDLPLAHGNHQLPEL